MPEGAIDRQAPLGIASIMAPATATMESATAGGIVPLASLSLVTSITPVRTLYISYDGVLEPLGESQVVTYLERLSARYDITLVSFE